MDVVLSWFRSFLPSPMQVGMRERCLGCIGAGFGVLLTEWISHVALGEANPWFIAPMGASAVLLFAVPASPLAQPWAMAGGCLVSALAGVASARWLHDPALAAGLAVALAIGAMFALRCLHPPGGAVALTAVLGGPAVAGLGFGFVALPVAANVGLLLLLALCFNNLAGRRYPHAPAAALHPHRTADPLPGARFGPSRADLETALADQHELIDVSADDLEAILVRAQSLALRHGLADLRCRDLMSRDVVCVGAWDTLAEAWARLARHRVRALPVTDGDGVLVGIVSLHDFFIAHAAISARAGPVVSTARYVEEIMSRRVRTANPAQPVAEVVACFSDEGMHHLPVVDDVGRVVGMVTQSDLIAALSRLAATGGGPGRGVSPRVEASRAAPVHRSSPDPA